MVIETWLTLGLIGWVALSGYRVFQNNFPKEATIGDFFNGFVFALFLGPFTIAFLIYLIVKDNRG